ncbi:MAG: uroporphyrinogen decarboxylase family protein [Syntrophobacteraceae bacterium]
MYYLYDNTNEVTPMERMMAALNGERTDRVPCHLYPRWSSLEFLGVTFKQSWDDPDIYVKAQILAQERFQYDCVIDYDMMGPVEEAIGSPLKYPENDVPQIASPLIVTKEDMKKAKWKLDPRKNGNMPKVLYVIRRLKEELIKRGKGKQRVPIMTWGSCPSRTAACLTGFKNWFLLLAKDPDWAVELMELAFDGWLQMVIAAWEEGADCVWVNDPVSAGDCISRKHYEQLTQPYERKFIEAIRYHTGMKVIMHPCGTWLDRMDLVYQNQADGYFLGPMDIKFCVDTAVKTNEAGLSRVKCINGNVGAATKSTTDGFIPLPYATTMDKGTPDEIEEEARICIETVEGAGLRSILGPNCWETPNTPFVNRDTMVYAARKYGTFKK